MSARPQVKKLRYLWMFFNQCTACGGNWGAMLLTGIKEVFPDSYDEVREQYNSMDFCDGGVRAFEF